MAQIFDKPQTWFLVSPSQGNVFPIPGVIRATKTTVTREIPYGVYDGCMRYTTCTYKRTEVFPTFSEAANAFVETAHVQHADAENKLLEAQAALEEAKDIHKYSVNMFVASHVITNPDAIAQRDGSIAFVTSNAKTIANTIDPGKGTVNDNEFRPEVTNKRDTRIQTEHFANEMRKLGLTVVNINRH